MAQATDVRVEATSQTTADLRWTDTASLSEEVSRSTDGVTYAVVAIATTGTDGLGIYSDTGLSAGTKYWYKLSNDGGSTFSSAVTVTTQSCGVGPALQSDLALPRAGDEVTPDSFNTLADAVETTLTKFTSPSGQTCIACVVDGALNLDCITYNDCATIQVVVDQSINSISMPNCNNVIKPIDFIIPPNTTRGICGFPAGLGFSGDECFQAPINGGTTGRTMSLATNSSKPGYSQGSGLGGGAGGGSGCTCVPDIVNGAPVLTIKSCNANNSLSCTSSNQRLQLKVCGGKGPYSWAHTGTVKFQGTAGDHSTDTDTVISSKLDMTPSVVVVPPVNTGSATAGTAFKVANKYTASAGGTCQNWVAWTDYGCNNQVLLESTAADGVGFFPCGSFTNLASLNCFTGGCCTGACTGTPQCAKIGCNSCTVAQLTAGGSTCDVRTAPMIAANCNPCGIAAGSTITVTDMLGTQVTIVLRA